MKLLFIITKGLEKAGSAIRALQVAALSASMGHDVEVFLMDEAVQWAQGVHAAGESLLDYMDMLSTGDRPILVCQSCADKRHISEADLIEGTAMATMPTLVEKLADPDYKVLNF